jgi:hypothetical protein
MGKYFIEIEGEKYLLHFPDGSKTLPYPLILI